MSGRYYGYERRKRKQFTKNITQLHIFVHSDTLCMAKSAPSNPLTYSMRHKKVTILHLYPYPSVVHTFCLVCPYPYLYDVHTFCLVHPYLYLYPYNVCTFCLHGTSIPVPVQCPYTFCLGSSESWDLLSLTTPVHLAQYTHTRTRTTPLRLAQYTCTRTTPIIQYHIHFNFHGVKLLQFSQISNHPQKFHPRNLHNAVFLLLETLQPQ